MAWPKGQRRRPLLAAEFFRSVAKESSYVRTAKAIGISDRQYRRIANGEHACSVELAEALADYACRDLRRCALPIYDTEMALDGHTRVGGVSEYSIRAARGDTQYVEAASFNEEK